MTGINYIRACLKALLPENKYFKNRELTSNN